MKKLLIVAVACIFAINSQAQNAPASSNTTPATKTQAAPAPAKAEPAKQASKDGVMMKDGKMWMMQGGKTTAMDKEMTMKNGCKVSTDGTCTMKDGKSMKMKNGDWMDMDGNMHMAKMEEKPKQAPAQPANK